MIKKRRPYSNYYKKKKYFLGGSIATVSTGSGAAVGSQVGMLGGPVGMMLGSLAGQGIGALASKLFKKKEPPPPPLNPFQGNTASSYGNFAMGGYAPLGPDSIKYIGPKHKDGGILIDENGMPTDNEQEAIAEVEGGETRDDNYIFSDELKYPGTDLTFAEVHETMVETGASEQDIEELKAIQEEVRESTGIAAKERAGMQMRNGSEIPKKDPPITQEFYTAPSERGPYNWAAQQQRIAQEELRKKEIEERRARIQDSLDVRDPQSGSYIPLIGEGSNLTERMARETQALGDKLRVSEEPNFFDDYINPLAFLGELTSGVGSVPKNVREGNYGAAAVGIGAPLVTGALAGIGARSAGQFANNLANPLAGVGDMVNNLGNRYFPNAYRLNPNALKEPQEKMLVRARPVGQDPYVNMAAQIRNKEARGEPLNWIQRNLLNPQTNPRILAREKYFGQWFADDPSDLDFYINKETRNFADDSQIELLRTRMPVSEASQYAVRNFDDARILSNRPDTEYILPKDVVQSLERFPVEDLGKLQSEYEKINTPHWLRGYKPAKVPRQIQSSPNAVRGFTSEIDWSKWNPETLQNKDLMDEYLAIEQQAKADGTWMKNSDGSDFVGTKPTQKDIIDNPMISNDMTPEEVVKVQFIQQRSQNLKNATKKRIEGLHGSPETFTEFDETKFGKSDRGSLGRGNYITDINSRGYAELYAKPNNYSMLEQFRKPKGNIYHLYADGSNMQKTSSLSKEQIKKLIGRDVENVIYGDNDYLNTGIKVSPDIVVPFNSYLKSAIGNNGMFDMTNPNIYKSVLPFGVVGASQMQEQKYGGKLKSYEDGGSLLDPERYQFQGGITPTLLLRQAFKESRFDPKAVSSKGYRGIAQLGDPAIEDFLKRHPDIESIDPFDPVQAAMVQRWMMNDLYNASFINKPNQSEGVRLAKTLAAYNWGRGNMLKFLNNLKSEGVDIYNSLDWLDRLPNETSDYIRKILLDEVPEFSKEYNDALEDLNNQIIIQNYTPQEEGQKRYGGTMNKYGKGGKMIKRADGSYSRRGLWDNIRANKGSGKKPTKQMLEQERKIKAAKKMMGGALPEYGKGGYTVTKSDRKGKTHKVTGPDGTVKHFGDPNLKNRPNNPKAKKSWYARHKKSLDKNPHFRAYARATWAYGGEVPMYRMGGINNPGFRALPEEVQDKIRANMGMGGMIEYANGGGIDNPGFRALPMEVQEKIKANMAMGGKLDYMYGGDMPEYKGGGSIKIAPEKRGTFKAQATKMGMGVQEAASKILAAPKGKYSPAMRRKANFARNFAKKYGGNMEYGYGGKMKYEGGGLLETGLQYLPEVFTAAKSIFGREKTPEPTQIARTRIPYQDTTFNINPQLQRSSASYRGMLADPAMTANQKMAAYSQKLQNEGQLYGQKENIENQRRMQLASQQAQLDAGRRQTQAGLDEQARQERMMNQANYGPFGNIMGAALSSASNKFLQQRGEDRYFDLMNKMYGQNNNPERPQKPKIPAKDDLSDLNSIIDQNLMEVENSISQALENIPEMNMTPLEMPQSEFSLSTEIMPEPSMLGSNYSFYGMPTLNFPQSPLLGSLRLRRGSSVNQNPNTTSSVAPFVGVLPEVTVTARRNLSEKDFRENPEKYTAPSTAAPLPNMDAFNEIRNKIRSKQPIGYQRPIRSGKDFVQPINLGMPNIEEFSPVFPRINSNSIEDKPSPYRNTSPLNPQSLQDIGLPQINRQRIREDVNKYKDYANSISGNNIFGLTEKMEEVANEIATGPSFLKDRYKDLFTAMSAQRRDKRNPPELSIVPRSGISRAEIPSVPQINTLNENANSNDITSFSPEEMDMLYSIESGGNPNAVSSAGAIGLGQIMPDTAMSPGFGLPTIFDLADREGVRYKDKSKSSVTELLKNENLNRMFSNLYVNKLLEKFGGNRRLALAAYNAGLGAVKRYSDVPPYEETQNYIKKFEEMGLNFND